ncbi:tripeptidyl-peptidase II Tpp2 [Chytriomyces hyalinus]|nr:tripeptidyl-peptidase II Tpp2 [Chytriomyces hyalinus]
METGITQVDSFLYSNPQFDGRTVVVAVLDTGVDPGAPGMQSTSTGEVKLLDLVDCSGAGTVKMGTTAKKSDSGVVMGLSGRSLRIPEHWPVPQNGEYQIGIKSAFSLLPNDVLKEMAKKNKTAAELANNKLLVNAMHALSAHESEFAVLSPSDVKQIEIRADLKARIQALKQFMKDFKDPGPVFDCITFHDGTRWLAAIDISQNGDLSTTELLPDYSDGHKFSSFGQDSRLNYSFKIYDAGQTLSIVTTTGSHGTHVAAITAAHFPDGESGFDGVAPGAQIVSLKIGDARLGGAETAQSLVRAAIELAKRKVDVVNVSFGEHAGTYDYGRFTELIRDDVINKLGTVFVTSAGNSGPILSSLSHPGGNSGVITVGAYVTQSMQEDMYALLETVPERAFSFSSNGPTLDGAVGVDIYAPGAAITSVPQSTKSVHQLMNGTSMSSPNAAGCVALLISGLKQIGKTNVSPYRVAYALKRSAKQFGDAFGIGIVQVENAWEMLINDTSNLLDVFYDVSVKGVNPGRGIYLRNAVETSTHHQFGVKVSPRFPDSDSPAATDLKLQFDASIRFESSHPEWIRAPQFARMAHSGREFLVDVDPTGLAPGLHVGRIFGFDSNAKETGDNAVPLFEIPVTVCKAENDGGNSNGLALRVFKGLTFGSGDIVRRYLDVPHGANFATLTIKTRDRIGNALFMIQFGQLHQNIASTVFETRARVNLSSTTSGAASDDFKWAKSFQVLGGKTAELVICQAWSTLGATTVDVQIEFHGLDLSCSTSPYADSGNSHGGTHLFLNSGNAAVARFDIASRLRAEALCAPSILLNTLQKAVRPTEEAVICALTAQRDILPDGKQLFELVLSYTFQVAEEGNVLPLFPHVLNAIYDSSYESFYIQIYDSQKSLQSYHQSKPEKTKLKEGTHTARVQFVSSDLAALERLKSCVLIINFELKKSISLKSSKSISGALSNTLPVEKTLLKKGECLSFWCAGVDDSLIPKHASPGDLLLGSAKVLDAAASNGASALNLFKVSYLVQAPESKAKDASSEAASVPSSLATETPLKEGESSALLKLQQEIRDLEIASVKKLNSDIQARTVLMERLQKDHSDHIPFLVARLEAYAADFEKLQKKDGLGVGITDEPAIQSITDACDAISGAIDSTALAQYFALKVDLAAGGEVAKAKKKDMETQKAALVLSLLWKARMKRNAVLVSGGDEGVLMTEFDAILINLAPWLGSSDAAADGRYLQLWAWRLRHKGLPGSALSYLNKYLSDSKNNGSGESDKAGKGALWKVLQKEKSEVLKELGWDFWTEFEQQWDARRSPAAFEAF